MQGLLRFSNLIEALLKRIAHADAWMFITCIAIITLIALPVMLCKGYDKSLAVGTIASAGTLGILIPPSIMLAVNMQTAFLTPPFGFALFYMKGTVPPSVKMPDICRGITPFVAVQLVALKLCMIFPEVVLYLPRAYGFLD